MPEEGADRLNLNLGEQGHQSDHRQERLPATASLADFRGDWMGGVVYCPRSLCSFGLFDHLLDAKHRSITISGIGRFLLNDLHTGAYGITSSSGGG